MCIPNYSVVMTTDAYSKILFKKRALVVLVALALVTIAGMNHFLNTLLSPLTVSKQFGRKCELRYKQVNFVYLVISGFLIFFCNAFTLL